MYPQTEDQAELMWVIIAQPKVTLLTFLRLRKSNSIKSLLYEPQHAVRKKWCLQTDS